jgi:hypothetical protein
MTHRGSYRDSKVNKDDEYDLRLFPEHLHHTEFYSSPLTHIITVDDSHQNIEIASFRDEASINTSGDQQTDGEETSHPKHMKKAEDDFRGRLFFF